MHDMATTALDVLGVLAVAAGLGLAVVQLAGPVGFAVSGAVLLGAVRLSEWQSRRGERR